MPQTLHRAGRRFPRRRDGQQRPGGGRGGGGGGGGKRGLNGPRGGGQKWVAAGGGGRFASRRGKKGGPGPVGLVLLPGSARSLASRSIHRQSWGSKAVHTPHQLSGSGLGWGESLSGGAQRRESSCPGEGKGPVTVTLHHQHHQHHKGGTPDPTRPDCQCFRWCRREDGSS